MNRQVTPLTYLAENSDMQTSLDLEAVRQWQAVLPARSPKGAHPDSDVELSRAGDDGWPVPAAQ